MSLAIIYCRAQVALDAPLVTVEVHITGGLPRFSIVGLPETAVRESIDRVRGALINSKFKFPDGRISVNLAPADLPKEGGRFDLPIALGILFASEQLESRDLSRWELLGELAMTGALRPIRGALPSTIAATGSGRQLILPAGNMNEAGLVHGANALGARNLLEVSQHLTGHRCLETEVRTIRPTPPRYPDWSDVGGQFRAKRALEVAAAGGHNLLMVGPPGTGKTMLATRLPAILPPLTDAEALETASIQSVSHGGFAIADWGIRPFRAPHHSASGPALVGGGGNPRPGEISLAHNGILFLDELAEFNRHVLEVLREPMESGRITISRAARQVEYPARFQLIAAMNPCPCGHLGDGRDRCGCTREQIQRYRSRISGPLLDRIDMHVEVPAVGRNVIADRTGAARERSAVIGERVRIARETQLRLRGMLNHMLDVPATERHCGLAPADERLLENAIERLGLSARAWHRVQRIARTIADLAGRDAIEGAHLAEAIAYRSLDRPVPG